MSNTQSVLTDLAETQFGAYSVRPHAGRIASAASAIDADPSPENVANVVRTQTSGLGVHVPQSFIDSVVNAVATPVEAEEEAVAYLTEAQVAALRDAAARNGAPSARVEAVLADSGLIEPEPEPEPEPEDEDEVSVLRRTVDSLVAFAKRHGFSG